MERRFAFDTDVRNAQSPEVACASLVMLSEGAFAEVADDRGIIGFHGRFWRPPEDSFGLIHVPLSPMALIKPDEFDYPCARTLGIVARVLGGKNNGVMRSHVLHNARNLDPFVNLEGSARRNIKSAVRAGVRIDLVTRSDSLLLTEGGYDVWINSAAGQARPLEKEPYLMAVRKMVQDGVLVLAASQHNVLIGYLSAYAIEEEKTAYLKRLIISKKHRAANAGSLLTYTFEQICSRTEGVDDIVNSRERDPGLTRYKIKMGFPLREDPVTVNLRFPMGLFFETIRKIKPVLYHRVYGYV